jgi:hypothetical protein
MGIRERQLGEVSRMGRSLEKKDAMPIEDFLIEK